MKWASKYRVTDEVQGLPEMTLPFLILRTKLANLFYFRKRIRKWYNLQKLKNTCNSICRNSNEIILLYLTTEIYLLSNKIFLSVSHCGWVQCTSEDNKQWLFVLNQKSGCNVFEMGGTCKTYVKYSFVLSVLQKDYNIVMDFKKLL